MYISRRYVFLGRESGEYVSEWGVFFGMIMGEFNT